MKLSKMAAVALGVALMAASAANAQSSDTSAQRCAELSAGVKNEFTKRLQSMAPKISPGDYVNQNTDAVKILSEKVGGGSFFGLNIGDLISGVSSKYLGGGSASGAFNQNINGILNSWGAQSVGSLGGGVSTPGFVPQAAATAAAPQPNILQRIFGGGSSSTSSTPYQR